jgi:hypothetical protein
MRIRTKRASVVVALLIAVGHAPERLAAQSGTTLTTAAVSSKVEDSLIARLPPPGRLRAPVPSEIGELPSGALASLIHSSGDHTYSLDPAASDDVHQAIERTISHVNFIIRPIARHRLARTNKIPGHVTLSVRSDTMVVAMEGYNPIATPLNGGAIPWVSGVSHEIYLAHATANGSTLHQIIQASDGWRTDDFAFLDSGSLLVLHVTLAAEHLPTLLQYTLIYRGDRTE